MGENDDAHEIYLDTFSVGKYPVTALEYQTFVDATEHPPPDYWPNGRYHPMFADHPVVNVSWFDALDFCHWLTETTAQRYRLPTEAEWEKAARGPDGHLYPWGDVFDPEKCNAWESLRGYTTPVTTFPHGASHYGLMDMTGNVWEWCSSLYHDYPYQPDDGREDLTDRDEWRVLRGGSWYDAEWGLRAARRLSSAPHHTSHNTGFRVACDLE
ncbi:MAG: SUMF1/EgtB/PvdO family nonheme iron enzyme [Anaerolineae bacterium]|nr:SUMF1/EgtB/PvdO family nonheme iron enzyme [Anaerolineae bacterium]